MVSFKDFNLPPTLLSALESMKVKTPTPIQAQAIPHALQGRDVIGTAQTGTGKTLAFALPVVTQLLHSQDRMALILVPTRELGVQIVEVLNQLTSKIVGFSVVALIGGKSMKGQMNSLAKKPSILVATPGRLFDHLQHESAHLETVKTLVIDEADRMLDMGFWPQLQRIMDALPPKKQILVFSATFPEDIRQMTVKQLENPVSISLGVRSQPVESIKQIIKETTLDKRDDLLPDELNARTGSVLIFAKTKEDVEQLNGYLKSYGYSVGLIHGDRGQGKRQAALEGLRTGKIRILVATDLAARGLDIPQISLVINYELPYSTEDYVHRIGRTGRAGAAGEALTFITPENKARWERISRFLSGKPADQKTKSSKPARKSSPAKRPSTKATQKGKRPTASAKKSSSSPQSRPGLKKANSQRGPKPKKK